MPTEPLTEVQRAAQTAVTEVRKAATKWATLPIATRVAKMREACQSILARADELAELATRETHKPLAESYSAEVLGVADLFAYWCDRGPALLAPRKGHVPSLEMPGKKATIERLPRGVVAVISPWNFPVSLPMRTLVPALLAGNGVVLKPSECTPKTGAWLVERLRTSLGGIVQVLPGAGDAGAALVEAGPDMVVFTGSTRTGRRVAVACAERGIPCELELGGKDCAVVLEGADLERTAAGVAWGILMNAGQNCSGIERVAVQATIAPAFLPLLVAAMERAAPDVCELVTPMQKELVIGHVRDAVAHGARLETGGVPDGGGPLRPTLLTGVPRSAPAWADESFGPTAVLEVCETDDDCIAAANDTRYGLGASVWCRDLNRARAVADRLRSGMVWINNHSFTGALPDLPWVGVGESGSGVTNSPEALMHLTRPRLVVIDSTNAIEPWWYPYGTAMIDLMRTLVARQQSGGIGALLGTLSALKKRNREVAGKG